MKGFEIQIKGKKIIFLFIGSLFIQEANLSFGEVSLANSTINIVLNNDMPISGFQFEVNTDSLISVESVTGGNALRLYR